MNYTITLTERQAATLSSACEILARLGIGQFRAALECLPTNELIPDGWHDDMAIIGKMLSKHMIGGVDGHGSSLGIHHQDVREDTRIAWDLHQVLRRQLAWDRAVAMGIVESVDSPRKWPEMMGVYYDDPHKVGGEALAVIRKH